MTRVVIRLLKLWEQWEFIAYHLLVNFELTKAWQCCSCRAARQIAPTRVGTRQQWIWWLRLESGEGELPATNTQYILVAYAPCYIYALHTCPSYTPSQCRWSNCLGIIFLWPDGSGSCFLFVMIKVMLQPHNIPVLNLHVSSPAHGGWSISLFE